MKVDSITQTPCNYYKINNNNYHTKKNNTYSTKSNIAALEQLGRSQLVFGSRDIMEKFSDDDILYIDDTAELYNFSERDKRKFAEGIYDAFKYTDTERLSDFIIKPSDEPDIQREKILKRKYLYEFINDSMNPDEETAQNIYNSLQTRLDNTTDSYIDYKLAVTIASTYCTQNSQINSFISLLDEATQLGGYSSYFDIFKPDTDKDMQNAVSKYMYKHLDFDENTSRHLITEFMIAADEPEDYRFSKLKKYQSYEKIYEKLSRDTINKSSRRNAFAVNQFVDEFFIKNKTPLSEIDLSYIIGAFFKRYPPEKCPIGENKDIRQIAKEVSKRFGLPKGSDEEIVHILKLTDSLKDIDILLINNIIENIENPQTDSNALSWNHGKKYYS